MFLLGQQLNFGHNHFQHFRLIFFQLEVTAKPDAEYLGRLVNSTEKTEQGTTFLQI